MEKKQKKAVCYMVVEPNLFLLKVFFYFLYFLTLVLDLKVIFSSFCFQLSTTMSGNERQQQQPGELGRDVPLFDE